MIVNDLTEIKLFNVSKRGIPNEEKIALRVNESINLGQYGILIGIRLPSTNGAVPLRDNMFWFGDLWVKKDDWIFIFTGSGERRSIKTDDNKNDIHIGFWGKDKTIMADPQVVPILFKIESVVLPELPEDKPQYKSLATY